MSEAQSQDYYETLQVSPNADAETIQRVFRLLAQRFHPDNQETGNASRFRELHDAYTILNDPEQRARYDLRHDAIRQERWKFAAIGTAGANDIETEQQLRCTLLEILYARRRTDPEHPSLSNIELAQLMGHPREHLEFAIWYATQKKFVIRDDRSSLTLTAEGVDYVEQKQSVRAPRRLSAVS